MANKTQPTSSSVTQFINAVADPDKRSDCRKVMKIMREVTGNRPRMWGTSLIGYGQYHYKYASGREGDFFITGLSPRAQNLSIYIMPGFDEYERLLARLGKHSLGKSCLYIKRLADVDVQVLEELISAGVKSMRRLYP